MSKKQSLSLEKYIHFIFHNYKYSLHLFKSSTVLGLVYSVLTRSILCLIDKSSQFCNTGIKYEVAITCALGCILHMSTISAVLMRTPNGHERATLHKFRALRYLIWFWKKKSSQQCLPVCPESLN